MSAIRDIALNDGVSIPQLGLGVFQVDPAETQANVETALEIGYRHIDTAKIYGNEAEVGAALSASDLPREDLFVTTKLWNSDQGHDSTLRAFDTSMEKLGLDVLDLYLIHWPTPQKDTFVDTWKAFEQLKADGRIRSIGVSNFRVEDLQKLLDAGLTVPSVNQIELHPALTQTELRAFHDEHGIATEAWSPLAQGQVFEEPAITQVAQAHGASPAQVILAWHLALGNIVFPKSVTPQRIADNFAATDIELTPDEIRSISGVNRDERIGPDPAAFN
ncbi:oxidoreductase, aldo/keto reductase family protein [Aeromicrobium marinum DSM 15272]|uniref:Oxidoreductase, aldo/keto reductase family protein n=1 Tax=Aeromicrobium marinum DSM 15272 TaxID=585531 RepID=E2SDG9_9ACTN|nr:aldo/keto reductase [Aeromicrobium marinum]EFQ82546.1 oxidoreductase, aldo/keto reductase family protein [Aeromicrobium marinum DSM 15272]